MLIHQKDGPVRQIATVRFRLHAYPMAVDKLELRAWLRRRLREPPMVAIDPARFTISDADIALILGTAREAAAGPDGADGGSDNRHSLAPGQ